MASREELQAILDARKAESERRKDLERIAKSRERYGLDETKSRMNLEGNRLALAIRQQQIDDEWYGVKPPTQTKGMHSGERRMLYELLDDGEHLESMVGGQFRQDTDRLHKHKGVAVATNKRILFLDKGIFGSTEVMEIAYPNIASVEYSTGMFFAGVNIVGRGVANYRIEDIPDKASVVPFTTCVRGHLDAVHEVGSGIADSDNESHVERLDRLAGLLDKGLLTRKEFEALKRDILSG